MLFWPPSARSLCHEPFRSAVRPSGSTRWRWMEISSRPPYKYPLEKLLWSMTRTRRQPEHRVLWCEIGSSRHDVSANLGLQRWWLRLSIGQIVSFAAGWKGFVVVMKSREPGSRRRLVLARYRFRVRTGHHFFSESSLGNEAMSGIYQEAGR